MSERWFVFGNNSGALHLTTTAWYDDAFVVSNLHWAINSYFSVVLSLAQHISIKQQLSQSENDFVVESINAPCYSICTNSKSLHHVVLVVRWLSGLSDVRPPLKSWIRAFYRTTDRTWEEFVNTTAAQGYFASICELYQDILVFYPLKCDVSQTINNSW